MASRNPSKVKKVITGTDWEPGAIPVRIHAITLVAPKTATECAVNVYEGITKAAAQFEALNLLGNTSEIGTKRERYDPPIGNHGGSSTKGVVVEVTGTGAVAYVQYD